MPAEILIEIYLYGWHLENPIWPPFAAFQNGTVVFIDPQNIRLGGKFSIVCHLEAEILEEICFYMAAILKSNMVATSIVK